MFRKERPSTTLSRVLKRRKSWKKKGNSVESIEKAKERSSLRTCASWYMCTSGKCCAKAKERLCQEEASRRKERKVMSKMSKEVRLGSES